MKSNKTGYLGKARALRSGSFCRWLGKFPGQRGRVDFPHWLGEARRQLSQQPAGLGRGEALRSCRFGSQMLELLEPEALRVLWFRDWSEPDRRFRVGSGVIGLDRKTSLWWWNW